MVLVDFCTDKKTMKNRIIFITLILLTALLAVAGPVWSGSSVLMHGLHLNILTVPLEHYAWIIGGISALVLLIAGWRFAAKVKSIEKDIRNGSSI